MKSRIFILTAALAALGTVTQAQKTTFGIRAGVNFTNLNGKDEAGTKYDNKLKTGYHAGVTADIPVASEFFVQPGLLFSTKGTKFPNSDGTVGLSYLEVPVNFLYKPALSGGHLLLGFGPYFGYGLDGRVKSGSTEQDIKFKNEVEPTDPTNHTYFKRTDAGANLLAGFETASKISVQLNAQLGLANIYPEYTALSNDKSVWKNTGFGVSVGYKF